MNHIRKFIFLPINKLFILEELDRKTAEIFHVRLNAQIDAEHLVQKHQQTMRRFHGVENEENDDENEIRSIPSNIFPLSCPQPPPVMQIQHNQVAQQNARNGGNVLCFTSPRKSCDIVWAGYGVLFTM